MLPFVSCLCPTFHRPKLLRNALACFLAQDYPPDRRELIILDDGQDYGPAGPYDAAGRAEYLYATLNTRGPVRLLSARDRFASLPAKFNAAAAAANPAASILLVWEDDDIYLPHHIAAHVAALTSDAHRDQGAYFSKPRTVLSTYTGRLIEENAAGRFHASIGFTRKLFDRVAGWPATKRADFDQQFMKTLADNGVTVSPSDFGPPSYCFRYGSTTAANGPVNGYHGQHFMQSPDDEGWYDRVPHRPGKRDLPLFADFDEETRSVYFATNNAKHLPGTTHEPAA